MKWIERNNNNQNYNTTNEITSVNLREEEREKIVPSSFNRWLDFRLLIMFEHYEMWELNGSS